MPNSLSDGVATFLPGAAVLHDGDETTAFDSDDSVTASYSSIS